MRRGAESCGLARHSSEALEDVQHQGLHRLYCLHRRTSQLTLRLPGWARARPGRWPRCTPESRRRAASR
eukprot:scaffold50558_cov30-Tisochrysis_lutea.AAC.15